MEKERKAFEALEVSSISTVKRIGLMVLLIADRDMHTVLQYDPVSDSDSDDSEDDLPRSDSSEDDSDEEELVDQEDGGSPRPRRRRKLNAHGQVSMQYISLPSSLASLLLAFVTSSGVDVLLCILYLFSGSLAETVEQTETSALLCSDQQVLPSRNVLRNFCRWNDLHSCSLPWQGR